MASADIILNLERNHMTNVQKFTWVDPTENTDGSPIVAGEITGFSIGVRSTTAAGSVAGSYPMVTPVAGATAASELLSALTTLLAPGSYASAIQTIGPKNSDWSPELDITIIAPQPKPPGSFSAV